VTEQPAPRFRRGPADLEPAWRAAFPGRQLIVVSNREPYEHVWDDREGAIEVHRPAGGLISALDPLMQAAGGKWVAWGSGDADREVVDTGDRIRVPPESEAYTLRRIWLGQQDVQRYYLGYSNQLLWPVCHLRTELARNRPSYRARYFEVNERFSRAVVDEAGDAAAIWFQDYHLALAPREVRRRAPRHTLAHFWHIPFPPIEIYRIINHGEELLRGLLANDLLGFHLPLFCDNFMRCCEALLGASVDWDSRSVTLDGHTCWVRALPISIDYDEFVGLAAGPEADRAVERIRSRFVGDGGRMGIGVDRIDYSKGLEEKMDALDRMWKRWPELRETFTYVQIAVPSRTGIDAYDWLSENVERLVWSINDRHGTEDWRPVHLIKESLPAERLALLYRAADVCVVSSLQDGMNLVAKEYVASQGQDGTGVLVLSRFAGAVEELDGCLPVNPYDPEDFALQLHDALMLDEAERRQRMGRLHASLRSIYDWMAETFDLWSAATRGETPPLSAADRWSRIG
jgi:trehalose 6-phosphate synthase/phosphatase